MSTSFATVQASILLLLQLYLLQASFNNRATPHLTTIISSFINCRSRRFPESFQPSHFSHFLCSYSQVHTRPDTRLRNFFSSIISSVLDPALLQLLEIYNRFWNFYQRNIKSSFDSC